MNNAAYNKSILKMEALPILCAFLRAHMKANEPVGYFCFLIVLAMVRRLWFIRTHHNHLAFFRMK